MGPPKEWGHKLGTAQLAILQQRTAASFEATEAQQQKALRVFPQGLFGYAMLWLNFNKGKQVIFIVAETDGFLLFLAVYQQGDGKVQKIRILLG